jgi:hypothetical protein
MQDLGFQKGQETFRIVGSLARLGNFRVRYGIAISKEHADFVCGLVLDVAYLPIELLSADYSRLFTYAYATIWKDRPRHTDRYTAPGRAVLEGDPGDGP